MGDKKVIWEFGYRGDKGFRRNMYGDAKSIKEWVLKYGPRDIYTSVFKYSNKDIENSNLSAGLYFDLDNEDNPQAAYEDLLALIDLLSIQGLVRNTYNIWYSGFKGFHLTFPWSAMQIETAKDLPQVYKKIAAEINELLPNKTIDSSVYESKRLWRFPNTINSKSNLYKVLLTGDIPSLDDIKIVAKTPQPITKADDIRQFETKILSLWVDRARRDIAEAQRPKMLQHVAKSQGISDNTKQLLLQGKEKGGRDNYIYWLACRLWHEKISENQAISELKITGEYCSPPASADVSDFNEKSIERTVQSAFRNKGGAR